MSIENEKTLATYDKTAQKYLENTIKHDLMKPERAKEKYEKLKEKIRVAFEPLARGSKILEVGSADGNNAKALESLGYDIIASDVAPAFILACEKQGLKTIKFNVLKDTFPSNLNGVLCWRVFVHFTREDIKLALNRIFNALESNGRLMFNVIDRATHDCDSEMKDFEGEYHMGAKRYYAYYRKEDIDELAKNAGFRIIDEWHENGGHNDWWCFVLEKQADKVDPKIREYVENEILPKYHKLGGHTDEHVRYVVNRSLGFHEQAPELNINMIYVIAAYHDLGRLIDDETHNIESAKMIRADKFLKECFPADEIKIMAEAVEDHRASLGREPRSIYGKLVSSADRDINYETMMSRVYDYTKHLHPEMTESEILEEARMHLREKYAKNGYALKTMYFNDATFNNTVEKIEYVTSDPKIFAEAMEIHNKSRAKMQ